MTSYHHGQLRQAMIDAAVDLLAAGGTLSLREAARRAGVSVAAPYRHFADKRAAFPPDIEREPGQTYTFRV